MIFSLCLLFVKTRCVNTISAYSTKVQSYITFHSNNMAADTNLYKDPQPRHPLSFRYWTGLDCHVSQGLFPFTKLVSLLAILILFCRMEIAECFAAKVPLRRQFVNLLHQRNLFVWAYSISIPTINPLMSMLLNYQICRQMTPTCK